MDYELFELLMAGFFALMVFCVLWKHLPTGVMGSLGCVVMALAAVFSIDYTQLTTLYSARTIIVMFAAGVALIAMEAIYRATRSRLPPNARRRRRRTDWGDLDTQPNVPMLHP
jgi:hypothetical protein